MQKTFGITLFIAFANAISFKILIPILYLYSREFWLMDCQILGLLTRGLTFVLTPLYANVIYFVCICIAFAMFNALV